MMKPTMVGVLWNNKTKIKYISWECYPKCSSVEFYNIVTVLKLLYIILLLSIFIAFNATNGDHKNANKIQHWECIRL